MAQRPCQGAAVNRVKRPGERLHSPAASPGEAMPQLPRLGLPLVFRARFVESDNSSSSSSSGPLVGKMMITLATAATLQRVEEDSAQVSRLCLPHATPDHCHTPFMANRQELCSEAPADKAGHGRLGSTGWCKERREHNGGKEPSRVPCRSARQKQVGGATPPTTSMRMQ